MIYSFNVFLRKLNFISSSSFEKEFEIRRSNLLNHKSRNFSEEKTEREREKILFVKEVEILKHLWEEEREERAGLARRRQREASPPSRDYKRVKWDPSPGFVVNQACKTLSEIFQFAGIWGGCESAG